MERLAAVVLIVLLSAGRSFADQGSSPPQKEEELRKGNRNVMVGLTIGVGGAFLLAQSAGSTGGDGVPAVVSASLLGGGAALALYGAAQRRRAVRPYVGFKLSGTKRASAGMTLQW